MVRHSNDRAELVRDIATAIPDAQRAVRQVDEAAAARMGLNLTDMRCLGILLDAGSMPAGRLAEIVGLTRGAMTTAIDRLERAGHVKRVNNAADGRGVDVEVTGAARRLVGGIWGPIRDEGVQVLMRYRLEELETIRRFLDEYLALQRRHAERIRRLAEPRGRSAAARATGRRSTASDR